MAVIPTDDTDTGHEPVEEAFYETLTLMSKGSSNPVKLRAFFIQKILRSGVFSLSPTLSFHAIVPDDSLIFELVRQGNVKGLVEELQNGRASLTDCDSHGRSLLGVRACHILLKKHIS
jgi:hypothetical protein